MKRPLALVSLALAAAAATAVLPASTASATELPGCPQTKLCVWTEPSFKGEVAMLQPGGGCVNAQEPIRSAANTWKGGGVGIPVILVVYTGKDCTGEELTGLARGESAPILSGDGLSTFSAW